MSCAAGGDSPAALRSTLAVRARCLSRDNLVRKI